MGIFKKKLNTDGYVKKFVNPVLRKKYSKLLLGEMKASCFYKIGDEMHTPEFIGKDVKESEAAMIIKKLNLITPSKVTMSFIESNALSLKRGLDNTIANELLKSHESDKPNPTLEIKKEITGRLCERWFNRAEGQPELIPFTDEQDYKYGQETYEYYICATARERVNKGLSQNKKFEWRSFYRNYIEREPHNFEIGRYEVAKGQYIVFVDAVSEHVKGAFIYGTKSPFSVSGIDDNARIEFTGLKPDDKYYKKEAVLVWWKARIKVERKDCIVVKAHW